MKKILFILSAAALLNIGCSQPHIASPKIPMTSGHRGANAIAPENTMASADSCI